MLPGRLPLDSAEPLPVLEVDVTEEEVWAVAPLRREAGMLDEGDPSGIGNALASNLRSLHGVQRRCKHRGARPLPEPRWTRLYIHIGWAVELAWWRGGVPSREVSRGGAAVELAATVPARDLHPK